MVECGIMGDNTIGDLSILPMRYLWARRCYKQSISHHWLPETVSLVDDAELLRLDKSKSDKKLVEHIVGFFAASLPLISDSIGLIFYRHITNPECRRYLLRQAYESTIHSDAMIYCCDMLHLNTDMQRKIKSCTDKQDFICSVATPFIGSHDPKDLIYQQCFVKELIGSYIVMEGIFFSSSFAMIRALTRNKSLQGVEALFAAMRKDVDHHVSFGCDLINTIKTEYPQVWTDAFQQDVIDFIKQAVSLERAFVTDIFPQNMLDYMAWDIGLYSEYVADCLCERIDLAPQFCHANPLPWMGQADSSELQEQIFDTPVDEYYQDELSEWE